MVQKMTAWGPVSIDGDLYTSRGKNGKAVNRIGSQEELMEILKEVFGIELSKKA